MTSSTGSGGGWWIPRDPDLGRDRTTRALGKRDWNFFAAYAGSSLSPADLEPAHSPWAGQAVTPTDRHDRTLGIPHRTVSMWAHLQPNLLDPTHASATNNTADTSHSHVAANGREDAEAIVDDARRARATAVIEELRWVPRPPSPIDVSPQALAQLLTDLAPAVHGRSTSRQYQAITQIADQWRLPAAAVLALARDTGGMIAKTTHLPPSPLPGEPNLNRLIDADLHLAAELVLARARLAWHATCSDPDLPRLWILANGLHHAVPAAVMLTHPARSHGPISKLIPEHHDLVGWHGIHTALDQLGATVTAAREGRRWLAGTRTLGPRGDARQTAEQRLLALGVVHLTHPRTAAELATATPADADLTRIRAVAETLPTPIHVIDLSDAALKAVCDRNSWLLGTPDERTQRELVERHTAPTLTQHDLRARVAAGDTTALTTAILATAPTDADLDRATWRHDPPAQDVTQRRQLLDLASRQALAVFAGHQITPHPTRAAAIAARYPDRLAEHGLTVPPHRLINPTTGPPPPGIANTQLDLGF